MSAPFRHPVSHRPSPVTIVLAAVLSVGVLVVLGYLAIVAPRGVPLLHYYHVNARFADASEIQDLSQVRVAGRQIGQVTGSSYIDGHAVVKMALYPGQRPLRSDTSARIRLNGLLGAKFVELTPGTHGRLMPSGSTLPASQTTTAVDIPTLLRTFTPATLNKLQVSVYGLGEGFLGRGTEINSMLGVSPTFFGEVGRISAGVLSQPGAAARFFPDTASLAGAYNPVREQLATGFRPEAQVLQAFENRSRKLQQTLADAPPALDALRQGLDETTPLLEQTAGLARATVSLTRPAPAALEQATRLFHDADPALRQTNPTLSSLSAAVPNTLGFLKHVNPVISPTDVTLADSVPILANLGQHSCDVLAFARNWRSTLGIGVPETPLPLAQGEPGLGPLTSLRVLVVRPLSELAADFPQPKRPSDAYPAPCQAETQGIS